jgi:hypothetical protein
MLRCWIADGSDCMEMAMATATAMVLLVAVTRIEES